MTRALAAWQSGLSFPTIAACCLSLHAGACILCFVSTLACSGGAVFIIADGIIADGSFAQCDCRTPQLAISANRPMHRSP